MELIIQRPVKTDVIIKDGGEVRMTKTVMQDFAVEVSNNALYFVRKDGLGSKLFDLTDDEVKALTKN